MLRVLFLAFEINLMRFDESMVSNANWFINSSEQWHRPRLMAPTKSKASTHTLAHTQLMTIIHVSISWSSFLLPNDKSRNRTSYETKIIKTWSFLQLVEDAMKRKLSPKLNRKKNIYISKQHFTYTRRARIQCKLENHLKAKKFTYA